MPLIFQYLLKLSVSLVIVFLFYQIVLRRLTFYNPNRFYLVGYTLLSFFIPFINITPLLQRNEMMNNKLVQFIPSVDAFAGNINSGTTAAVNVPAEWTASNWLLICLFTGMMLMLIRLLVQLLSFKKIMHSAQLISDGGVKLYQVNQSITPFSFGNSIFINRRLHIGKETEEIIHHEFVHVKQKHTIDIIWGELLFILNWYNPFAWLLRRAIRENLEFIADSSVLQNGFDKKQYQYLLLKVIGNNHFSIASQFNFSSLKKRIAMMNKIKSTRVHLLKFLFLLPLVAVLLLAFRHRHPASDSQIRISSITNAPKETENYPGNVQLINQSSAAIDTSEKKFLKRNPSVRSFQYLPKNAEHPKSITISLKSGAKEVYDLNDEAQMKNFRSKYGEFPAVEVVVRVKASHATSRANGSYKVPIPSGDAKGISVNEENIAIVELRNGKVKKYDLNRTEEKKAFEEKYDNQSQSVELIETSTIASATDIVARPVIATSINNNIDVVNLTSTRVSPTLAASTEVADVSDVSIATNVNINNIKGNILFDITNNTSRKEIDRLIAGLKTGGYELIIKNIEFKDNSLILLDGTISNGSAIEHFIARDFSRMMILESKNNKQVPFFHFSIFHGKLNIQ